MNTFTLSSLDLSKIKRIKVSRPNGKCSTLATSAVIKRFISNHEDAEVVESKLWHGYASSKPGKDYVAFVIACVEPEVSGVAS